MNLDEILMRSVELDQAVMHILEPTVNQTSDLSKRISASFAACSISLEHGRGLRLLIAEGLSTSAISLMRLQFEALTRSVWLAYAASDLEVEKLQAPLTAETQKAANKLPMQAAMLDAIDGKAPPAATMMLKHFKDVTVGALHSFVHGGIHPINRQSRGYPAPLLINVVRNSNGLLTMSGMMLANLSGNEGVSQGMSRIQPAFMDCLPELLHTPSGFQH